MQNFICSLNVYFSGSEIEQQFLQCSLNKRTKAPQVKFWSIDIIFIPLLHWMHFTSVGIGLVYHHLTHSEQWIGSQLINLYYGSPNIVPDVEGTVLVTVFRNSSEQYMLLTLRSSVSSENHEKKKNLMNMKNSIQ